jgi:hypothetical protein
MNKNNPYVKLISIFVTFFIFLGALVFMKNAGVPQVARIIIAIVLVFVIDYVKGKIFR